VTASTGAIEELVIGEAGLAQIREARTVLHTLRDDDWSFFERRVGKIMTRHYI